MRKALSTFELEDCNKALAEAGFKGRLHLHDVCGGQYLSWDEGGATETGLDIRTWLSDYFGGRGYRVDFDGDRPAFRLS